MIIAIFLENMKYERLNNGLKQIYLLYVTNEIIYKIAEELITIFNINYLMLWLLDKKVEIIFIDNIDSITKKIIEDSGIEVRNMEDIKKNPLLNSILIR